MHALVRLVDAFGRDLELVFHPEDVLPLALRVRPRGPEERLKVGRGDDLSQSPGRALQVAPTCGGQ